MADFGKLILSVPGEAGQEFLLNKPTVSIGRATTNDIVLPDGHTSRFHAQVQCAAEAITLADLGSANGTWLNEQKVPAAAIQEDDRIRIGRCTLTYHASTPATLEEATLIDTDSQLDQTLEELKAPVALNDTSRPRLVVHAPDRTWEISLEGDSLAIGRTASSDLALDYAKVSRQHARIERKGELFSLRDLQSTNGTWFGAERIEQRLLQNGDTLRIGPARLVFKSGFAQEELTLMDGLDASPKSGLKPVIFVPGMMGSELWLGSERVWPNVNYLFKHPEVVRYTEDTRLEARGVLNEIVIIPNLITFEQYSHLGDYLVEELGYERGVNFIEFAYDWRQDVRRSARALGQLIENWAVEQPITIIAHSLGTLVSRYYVTKLSGKEKVNRLLLMGGPHQGVPKIAANLLTGVDMLPFGLMGKRLTEVIETFPSSYQILPLYPCANDQNGAPIRFLDDESWVKEAYRPLLRAAREFRRELGMQTSVPTVSIFGYGLKTSTHIQLQRDAQGVFQKLSIGLEPRGDNTIPETSAVLPGTEIHPVQQHHGTIFNDNDVLMRLKLELLGR